MKREVTDHEVAQHLANRHPKARRAYGPYLQMPSNRPSEGAAPGANGPPTTGASGPGFGQ